MHLVQFSHDVIGLTNATETTRRNMVTILQHAIQEEVAPVVANERVHKLADLFEAVRKSSRAGRQTSLEFPAKVAEFMAEFPGCCSDGDPPIHSRIDAALLISKEHAADELLIVDALTSPSFLSCSFQCFGGLL